jgi:signal transduction histidine kinase
MAKAIEIQNVQTYERLKKARESGDQTRVIRIIEHEREMTNELREREMLRTEEMRKAKEVADLANKAKSSFLAVISHEIRTPMNGVIGTLRMLKQTPLSEKQNDLVETIYASTDSMMVLINDILDFEKIEKGKMVLDIIPFDIYKLVDDVMKLMMGHVDAKNIKHR